MKELMWNSKVVLHLCFWMAFCVYIGVIKPIEGALPIQIIGTSMVILNYAMIYYAQSLFIFPQFVQKKKTLLLFLILLFMLYACFDIFIVRIFFKSHLVESKFSDGPMHILMLGDFITFGIISTLSLGSYQNKKWIEEQTRNNCTEKALIFKDINFLKNQFNAHITFNFLNYCYSRIHKSSYQTAEAIEVFSRMLRYSLSNKVDKKVPLKKEIEYIEDFILLQKLLDAEIQIQFTVETNNYNSIYISPQILMPLVESAFKHSNVNSCSQPIGIELTILNECLDFKVTNEKGSKKIIKASGTGYNNVKQQLDLVYKDQYYLDITDVNNSYSAHLKLIIN